MKETDTMDRYIPVPLVLSPEAKKNFSIKEKEIKEKIASDPGVRILKELISQQDWCGTVKLTGGAIIDILEGRIPKDYDLFLNSHQTDEAILKKTQGIEGLHFVSLSTTAISFVYKGLFIQILRKTPEKYFFTIEQSIYNIKAGTLERFCYLSFKQKTLIPNAVIFGQGVVNRKAYKYRIKHWAKKGYKIDKISERSYKSLTWTPSLFGFLKSVGDASYKQS